MDFRPILGCSFMLCALFIASYILNVPAAVRAQHDNEFASERKLIMMVANEISTTSKGNELNKPFIICETDETKTHMPQWRIRDCRELISKLSARGSRRVNDYPWCLARISIREIETESATLEIGISCGPLSGSGHTGFYQRTEQGWKFIRSTPLWFS